MANSADQLLHQAVAHHQRGQLAEAERIYQQVLLIQPNQPDALHLLGVLAMQANQFSQAVPLIQRAIAVHPVAGAFHFDLSIALLRSNRSDEAADALSQFVPLATGGVKLMQAGELLQKLGRVDAAMAAYRRALEQDPSSVTLMVALAILLVEGHEPEKAEWYLRKALSLHRGFAPAMLWLGWSLIRQWRSAEAEPILRQLVEQHPNDHAARNVLGLSLSGKNDLPGGIVELRQAMTLKPGDPPTAWNLSRALILNGDWIEGWRMYESRLQLPNLGLKRDFPQPQWDGSDPTGRTILLHAEGGHGDAIQFVRYAPMVAARGAIVLLECHPALVSLLARTPGISQTFSYGDPMPPFDCQIPLQSLISIFQTTPTNVPGNVSYLVPSEQLCETWREKLHGDSSLKVGLVWCGSDSVGGQRTRSIDVFAPLAAVMGVTFYSLQVGPAGTQPPPAGMRMIDLTGQIKSFDDSAAMVMNLDLVISIDTSVAHLAGALGKPVWVLIPINPDFRWMLERSDTPWYPTMRLYRQRERGRWDDVIVRMRADLQHLALDEHVR
jgi:Flp pilus assembly protein TadD